LHVRPKGKPDAPAIDERRHGEPSPARAVKRRDPPADDAPDGGPDDDVRRKVSTRLVAHVADPRRRRREKKEPRGSSANLRSSEMSGLYTSGRIFPVPLFGTEGKTTASAIVSTYIRESSGQSWRGIVAMATVIAPTDKLDFGPPPRS
jgi:hypothetical protein